MNAISPRPARVVVFADARREQLKGAIESLLTEPEAQATDPYVSCDGAKRPEHRKAIDAVRLHVETIRGFASITSVFRHRNLGLAKSIIAGVSEVVETRGRVVVVESACASRRGS